MKKRDRIILLIGAFKLVKGIVLAALGIAIIAFERDGIVHHIRTLADTVGIRPAHVDDAIAKLTTVDPSTLRKIGAGSLVYSTLFFIEGIGLLRRRVWAEYFTILITTSFIPIEVYEMVEHESVVKGLVIAVNVLAVGYLVWRLRRDHAWPFK